MALLDDGIWHSFTVRAGEPIVVVANPSGTTPRVEATSFSTASNHCPPQSDDSLSRRDGEAIYLAGCAAGQATVELRRAADQTLLRNYTFFIEEAPAATTGPGISRIYWTNGEKVQRADSDGFNVEDVIVAGSPRELAVDVLDGKIYWTDQGSRKIRRAGLDGSNAADVVSSGLISLVAIALDPEGGKVCWTDFGTDKIQRANLDGSQIEDVVSTGLRIAKGLALDLVAGKMYWTDSGTNKVQRANLDGFNVEDILTASAGAALGLAVVFPVASLSPRPICDDLQQQW